VLEAIPEARFAIVGDGPHREALESHFAGTNTHFVGYLHGVELASAFASADAFLFPSRTETLGLVLLESMAAGCPVVAANSGGIPDIVTDGVNGYLFDPRDENGLISATKRLLTAKAEREELRQNARLEAEKWGWQAATQQLLNYYQQVLKNNSVAFAA
jgi:glycosyltransferase involved in cell wall biosynthesis